jgi:hypothetical protein
VKVSLRAYLLVVWRAICRQPVIAYATFEAPVTLLSSALMVGCLIKQADPAPPADSVEINFP